jgi:Resolvase, N terminal domain
MKKSSGHASITVYDLGPLLSAARCGLSRGLGAAWAVSGMGRLLGYARVSTTHQHSQLQVGPGARRLLLVFTETVSGARATGPSLSSSWTSCARATPLWSGSSTASAGRSGSWSTPSPASPSAALGSAACRRRSTPPPPWQARLPAFAALAEFERDLIRERTAAGLAAARARGHRGGRPSVLTGHKLRSPRSCTSRGSARWRRSP